MNLMRHPQALAICLFFPAILQCAWLPVVLAKKGSVQQETITIRALDPTKQYSLLYSLSPLRALTPGSRVEIELRQGARGLASKTLHAGDPDYYTQIRVPVRGDAQLIIHPIAASARYDLQVNQWPQTSAVKAGNILMTRKVTNAGRLFRSRLPATRNPLRAKKAGTITQTTGFNGPP